MDTLWCGFSYSFRYHMKNIALFISLIPLFFLPNALGSSLHIQWLSPLSIHFSFSVDALSLIFLYLVNIIIPLTILTSKSYFLPILLQWLLIGFFTAQDLVFFTFFFEAMLIPLYFMINSRRSDTAFTFLLYMIAGSTLMVAAVLGLFLQTNTFDIPTLIKTASQVPHKELIFAAFLLAFAVKTPLFPFHSWLPDSYTHAPLSGTIYLSALLSKAGIYGIARIGFGLFPALLQAISPLLLILSICGVLYGAFAAWAENNFKRLIAYSSFSHINFVLAGLFIWNDFAQTGAILQAVNHSITITGLFLVAFWLEERIGTTSMKQVSGLTKALPTLSWLTLFFVLSSVALPGLNSFVGEVLVLFGAFQHNPWYAFFLGLTVIFSVLYMLRFMQQVYFQTPQWNMCTQDITSTHLVIASPLIILVLFLGLYPKPILELVSMFLR